MRDDMARVIVERPRIPDHGARKGRSLPLDQLPAQEGMRRPHVRFWGGKQLNENLAPLRRYLERQAQLAADQLDRFALHKVQPTDLRDRLHYQHPLQAPRPQGANQNPIKGVPFGRRSPPQRGPFSTPKHTVALQMPQAPHLQRLERVGLLSRSARDVDDTRPAGVTQKLPIELGPALGVHLAFERAADIKIAAQPQLLCGQVLSAGALKAAGDVG